MERWRQLKGRLRVHEQQLQHEHGAAAGAAGSAGAYSIETGLAAAAEGTAGADAAPTVVVVVPLPERIQRLEKVTALQRAVFGLGDALQVLTLSANCNAARSAERQGVHLEVALHRAVWLAGM